ncbi:lipid-A-disaccharide synthase-related protein [Crocosphaera sp.]|uniref:lipid-A-disaccharide synthase-related protein n=1 Tax=Crocosphaera sp. TaxID=2729996 RepID=UPI00262187F8|nr:lipid-A-disaccharide synthase-related protein [Crocosphaera sp.]MDJ0579904.1 lipid-A-disaccharide synthase-related protein [Crocosphaera sp.]
MEILVISNGHGEDVIAVSIAQELRQFPDITKISALPLVGKGYAYEKANIPIIGTVKTMPSGGFNQDINQLWRDFNGGLLNLTYHQYKTIKRWGENGGKILAVGDILPLLFAWLSGGEFAFVGTAKSEYYLRDETRWLTSTSFLERWLGSMYFPWERWLMNRLTCCGVFVRDSLTAQILEKFSIPVYDLGNPMMDNFSVNKSLTFPSETETLIILLLPGSRMPEAQNNWQLILQAVDSIKAVFSQRSLLFLAAITPSFNSIPFQEDLIDKNWQKEAKNTYNLSISDPQAILFTQGETSLILTQQAYQTCLQLSHVGIAMAGTATEQFVGLGKPVISFPGNGPQFTKKFAQNQTRLLGCSVTLVDTPQQVGDSLTQLIKDPKKLENIAKNGQKRLGKPGAAQRIANCLVNKCFNS